MSDVTKNEDITTLDSHSPILPTKITDITTKDSHS